MSDDWKDALAALRANVPDGVDDSSQTDDSAEDALAKAKVRTLEIVYERKGRGGHPATIVVCQPNMPDKDVAALAATLRRRLGVGGSAREGEILLQGDRRDALRTILTDLGFKTKG